MIIVLGGNSCLGKLAASFPDVMLQMQDPNLAMLLNGSSQIRKSLQPTAVFSKKIQQLNQPGNMK